MYRRRVPTTSHDPVAVPRLAATVLLLRDDPFQVLMVRRRRGGTFSNALVFPGGVIESSDADAAWLPHLTGTNGLTPETRALRIGALRETYEEASILIARLSDGSPIPPGPPDDGTPFRELLARRGAMLALDELHPFGHWVTPAVEPRRFDTMFLLCRAPDGHLARQDDGETIGFEWAAPAELLERAAAGERSLLFPTLMNLRRLAESTSAVEAITAADARPLVKVEPHARRDGDRIVITIPESTGYGVTENVIDALQTGEPERAGP
jgi:8-oxo-dGTP pyrophosphatase MutT (NUDIX family)